MRAVAMLSFHNEADILGEVIDNLLEQELEVVALDNGSDDGAYEICAEYAGRGEIVLERWEPEGIDLNLLTRRLYRRALELDPDWMLWCDGDELLQPLDPGRTLRAVIEEADSAAMNLVPFDRFDFFMSDADDPGEPRVTRRLRHYSWQGDCSYRAWRYAPGIRAEPSLAHVPIFPDGLRYRIHDEKQVLRNYPYRSPAQAEAKLGAFLSKFGDDAASLADWQRRYVELAADGTCTRAAPAGALAAYDGDGAWRREPLHTPFTWRQPSREEMFTPDGRLKLPLGTSAPLEDPPGPVETRP